MPGRIRRANDSVLALSFALNREKAEKEYIIPTLAKFVRMFMTIDIVQKPVDYFNFFFETVTFRNNEDSSRIDIIPWGVGNFNTLGRIFSLYGMHISYNELLGPYRDFFSFIHDKMNARNHHGRKFITIKLDDSDNASLIQTTIPERFYDIRGRIEDLLESVRKAHESKKTLLSELIIKKRR